MSLTNPAITYIQIVFYNMQMKAPSAEDLASWTRHFDLERHPNWKVLGGTPNLVNSKTYKLIPGIHLVDGDFILRLDASGHQPRDDMYRTLIPKIGELLSAR